MTGNPIPTQSRAVVKGRDLGRCIRCGGAANQYHHRRRRRILDAHTHKPCNALTLCSVCHAWVHANPVAARTHGWIVSAWEDHPGMLPVSTFLWGWVLLHHDGTFTHLSECEQCGQPALLDGGLCVNCLRLEVCCRTPQEAAAAYCGCGGAAAAAVRQLEERMHA